MANHLTPTELADEVNMKRREVISKCMEMGVPIFNGRIDKTLFVVLAAPAHAAGQARRGLTQPPRSAEHSTLRLETGPPAASVGDARGAQAQRRRAWRQPPYRAADAATGVRRRSPTCFRSPPQRYGDDARGHVQGRVRHSGSTKTFAEVGEIVRAALARPDGPRDREGRQGLDPRQHPPGVDLLRLRGADRRRDRGPDLPDQLARGVPVRARELRRQGRDRRGRRAARRRSAQVRDRLPEARARDPDDRVQRGRDLDAEDLSTRGAARTTTEWEERWRSVDSRRHLHLHLHVGHDRARRRAA